MNTLEPKITEKNEFDIVIEPRESDLNGLLCKEKINVKHFKNIYKYRKELLKAPCDYNGRTYDESLMFEKYEKLLKKNRYDYAEVEWKRRKIQYGRVFSKNGNSVMVFRDVLRGALCGDYYYDIDIDNCYPSILNQICIMNGKKYVNKELNNYVNNRDAILKELMDKFSVERYVIKVLFIRLLFGGSIKKWIEDFNIKGEIDEFVYRFEKEIKNISDNIFKKNKILQKHITQTRMKENPFYDKARTWEGNVLSTFLGHYEEMILESIYHYLVKNRYIIDNDCILAFDGIMLRKSGVDNVSKLLKEIEEYVYEDLGFVINMSRKMMDVSLIEKLNKLLENEKESEDNNMKNCNEVIDELLEEFEEKFEYEDLDSFNERFFNYIGDKYEDYNMSSDYYLKREYFTRYRIYLSESKSFLIKSRNILNGAWEYDRQSSLNFAHLKYEKKITKDNGESIKTKYSYDIMVYKEDASYPRYNTDRFNPMSIYEKMKKTNYFNKFMGFAYRNNKDFEEEDVKLLEEYLEYMLEYICGGKIDVLIYYLSHLREIMINPKKKNGIGIVLYSKDKGCGKNNHCDFVKKVIGEYLCVNTDISALFERFSDIDDYLIAFFEEVSSDALGKNGNYSTLKTKITDHHSRRDIKNIDPRKSLSFTRFFFLTNELNSLKTDSDERRLFFLEIVKEFNEMKKQKIYKLLKRIEANDKISGLFGYFLEKCKLLKSYGNQTEWNDNKPLTNTSLLFKKETAIEGFLTNVIMNTLSDNNEYGCIDKKVIIEKKDGAYIFSLNKLYLLFLNDYNSNNNKKGSFKKKTFESEVLGVYNKAIIKKDSVRGEITITINKDYFVNRLIELKLLNKDVNKSSIEEHLNNIHSISKEHIKEDNKKIINKINNMKKKINNINKKDDKKEREDYDKGVKEAFEILRTKFDIEIEEPKKIVKKKVIKKVIKKKKVKKTIIIEEYDEYSVDEDLLDLDCMIE